MGKIKKVRFSQSLGGEKDRFDRAFWDEFFRLEELSAKRSGGMGEARGRLVTITIRDEETGQEWVIKRVRLLREKLSKVGD